MSSEPFNASSLGCSTGPSLQNCSDETFFDYEGAGKLIGEGAIAPPGGPPGRGSNAGPFPMGPPPIPPDAYIDSKLFFILEMIINSGLVNMVAILGSSGNIMSIIILCKQGLKSSSMNVVLVSMAVADLLILITLPLRKINLLVGLFDKVLARTVESHVLAFGFLAFNRTWAVISHSHVVIIAMERFLAVYFPLKVRLWVSPLKVALICVSTHVIWYALLWPMHTTFSLHWVTAPTTNRSVAIAWISDFHMRHEETINFYISYGINLVNVALQLTIVIVCSAAIGCKVVSMGKVRNKITSGGMENEPRMRKLNSSAEPFTTTDTTSRVTASSEATHLSDELVDRDPVMLRALQGGAYKRISEDVSKAPTVDVVDPANVRVNDNVTDDGDTPDSERSTENFAPNAVRGSREAPRGQPVDESHPASVSTIQYIENRGDLTRRESPSETNMRYNAPSSADLKVIKMLLLVCLAYIIFIVPTFLLFVFQQAYPELKEPRWVRVNFLCTSISMLLLALNSAVNFIIYVYMSTKFQKSFHQICRCPCGKN